MERERQSQLRPHGSWGGAPAQRQGPRRRRPQLLQLCLRILAHQRRTVRPHGRTRRLDGDGKPSRGSPLVCVGQPARRQSAGRRRGEVHRRRWTGGHEWRGDLRSEFRSLDPARQFESGPLHLRGHAADGRDRARGGRVRRGAGPAVGRDPDLRRDGADDDGLAVPVAERQRLEQRQRHPDAQRRGRRHRRAVDHLQPHRRAERRSDRRRQFDRVHYCERRHHHGHVSREG